MADQMTCPVCGEPWGGQGTRCRDCRQYEDDQRDPQEPRDVYEDEFWPIDNRRDV